MRLKHLNLYIITYHKMRICNYIQSVGKSLCKLLEEEDNIGKNHFHNGNYMVSFLLLNKYRVFRFKRNEYFNINEDIIMKFSVMLISIMRNRIISILFMNNDAIICHYHKFVDNFSENNCILSKFLTYSLHSV